VNTFGIGKALFLPSLACLLVPLVIAGFRMKGFTILRVQLSMAEVIKEEKMRGSLSVFLVGIFGLVMVPVIK
jgi:hypothetical protein